MKLSSRLQRFVTIQIRALEKKNNLKRTKIGAPMYLTKTLKWLKAEVLELKQNKKYLEEQKNRSSRCLKIIKKT